MQVLEGEGAIAKNREVMGATNPADAAAGTIRAEFAESVGENSVHGSDAPETAAEEIAIFLFRYRAGRLNHSNVYWGGCCAFMSNTRLFP